MKNIALLLLLILSFSACEKEEMNMVPLKNHQDILEHTWTYQMSVVNQDTIDYLFLTDSINNIESKDEMFDFIYHFGFFNLNLREGIISRNMLDDNYHKYTEWYVDKNQLLFFSDKYPDKNFTIIESSQHLLILYYTLESKKIQVNLFNDR